MAIDDDGLELIRQLAVTDSALKAIIKNRFYLTELPQIKKPKYPNMSIHFLSSTNVVRSPNFKTLIFVLWAYSQESYEEAKNAYNAFFDKFNAQRFSGTGLGINVNIVIDERDGPERLFAQKQKLFYYRARWNLTISLRA